MKPSVQFTKRKDGVTIAYTTFGTGPPFIYPAAWVTDLAFFLEDKHCYDFWKKLSQKVTVVLYDKHGCGQSDRDRTKFTLDAELLDLETIIDCLKLHEVILFGSSCAGPVSVAYTVRHPQKVSHLILYGTWTNGDEIAKKEVRSAMIALIKASWGIGSKTMADLLVPGATPEILQQLAKFQRASCSPEIAAGLLGLAYSFNVTEFLSNITTPTLILHRERDRTSPISQGRKFATEMPNAVFKVLKGDIHIPWYGNTSEIIDEILDFIGRSSATEIRDLEDDYAERGSETARQATIVFSDIVSSTDLVNSLGDAKARDIFLQHDNIIRNEIKKYNGKELQNLGDGFMLSFGSATAAIKCACEIQQEAAQNLPQLQIRIGINTGEVIKR
jgi:pimeloyl-ACP methyl ester carboxylesterase